MNILRIILIFIQTPAFNGQSSWSPSSILSRVPGLHPVGGSIGFPQFLAVHTSHSSGSTHRSACPQVNRDCPKPCRKADSKGCRICDCNGLNEISGSCKISQASCPKSCRKLDDKGCKICSCKNSQSASMTSISTSTFKKCYAMLKCMITCNKGYTLGSVTNEYGCQTCTCMDSHKNQEGRGNLGNGFSSTSNSNTDTELSWSFTSLVHSNTIDNEGNSNVWNKETGNKLSNTGSPENTNKDTWESVSGGHNNDIEKDIWGTKDGIGESSSGCSGPLCPGNSGEMNPMFPGASSNGGVSSAINGGCQGPFCAGQGGMGSMGTGMSGTRGSGSNGCSGPFCTMSGSANGMGGAFGGGMGGMAGGMVGSSGGGMGGPGGVGAFSPFGLAAGSKTGGASSGCNGPFCTLSTGNNVNGASVESTMTSSTDRIFNEVGHSSCAGPTCAAKDGRTY